MREAFTMVIFKDGHRFELTVEQSYTEWVASLCEYVPGRLAPIPHLLRTFLTRQAAIEALKRKWQLLFPEHAPLRWRDPPHIQPVRRSRGKRQPKE